MAHRPGQGEGQIPPDHPQTEIDGTCWAEAHWKALETPSSRHFSTKAACSSRRYPAPYPFVAAQSRIDRGVLLSLGIPQIQPLLDYTLIDGKTERLADLCAQAEGTEYISGPAAKDYIEERVFTERCIKLSWFDYTGYTEYPQLWGDFIHGLSILDLLFNCGRDAPRYMKHVGIR
jgi:hypothetical protein